MKNFQNTKSAQLCSGLGASGFRLCSPWQLLDLLQWQREGLHTGAFLDEGEEGEGGEGEEEGEEEEEEKEGEKEEQHE